MKNEMSKAFHIIYIISTTIKRGVSFAFTKKVLSYFQLKIIFLLKKLLVFRFKAIHTKAFFTRDCTPRITIKAHKFMPIDVRLSGIKINE